MHVGGGSRRTTGACRARCWGPCHWTSPHLECQTGSRCPPCTPCMETIVTTRLVAGTEAWRGKLAAVAAAALSVPAWLTTCCHPGCCLQTRQPTAARGPPTTCAEGAAGCAVAAAAGPAGMPLPRAAARAAETVAPAAAGAAGAGAPLRPPPRGASQEARRALRSAAGRSAEPPAAAERRRRTGPRSQASLAGRCRLHVGPAIRNERAQRYKPPSDGGGGGGAATWRSGMRRAHPSVLQHALLLVAQAQSKQSLHLTGAMLWH